MDSVTLLAAQWLDWDPNPETRAQIQRLLDDQDLARLETLLRPRIAFGTAGLRAAVGAGFARMNQLTVMQATQGVCEYLLRTVPRCQEMGVIVGHDHRHGSADFARITAAVFRSKSVPVRMYQQLVHTPLVPFAVRYYGAACGIMITASHNPKQDNGYKLYGANGCQIISPHDQHIQKAIEENLVPWISGAQVLAQEPTALGVQWIPDSTVDAYFAQVRKLAMPTEKKDGLPVVYTPMHGVGRPFAERVFHEFGLTPFVNVEKQMHPDPDFPTVKYPNPEEGEGALQLAMEKARSVGANVIFANDPDADRLAVAEFEPGYHHDTGKWVVLSGNQIGSLLASYLWQTRAPASDKEKVCMLASTVSSKMLRRMAQREGFRFEETLTGFKWLGNKALDLQAQGYQVLFAYEEAIGFMVGNVVWDKDGISALGIMAEMTNQLYSRDSTLLQELESLYARYGYFCSRNGYFVCHSPPTIAEIFARIRNYPGTGAYPTSIGTFRIVQVRDLTTGHDSSQPDGKATLPISKSSQMITFEVVSSGEQQQQHQQDGGVKTAAVLTLRTSGTEPKIKYYSEMEGPWERRALVESALDQLVAAMTKDLIRPDLYGM